MGKYRTAKIYLVYYIIYALVYAGWLFHRSINPEIFIYSKSYFLFLSIMTMPFFLPLVIAFYRKHIGLKGAGYAFIIAALVLFVIYFISAQIYYYTQCHHFDPFLQNAISKIDGLNDSKPANQYRILCLGGSTTEELAISEEGRYPNVLERVLKDRYPDADIRVFNGGKNWYTTRHSLISYTTYYVDWKPDLVIVMHTINDLCRSFSPRDFAIGEYDELWTHFYGPAINGARPLTFEQKILGYFEVPMNAWYAKYRFLEKDYPTERYLSLPSFEKNLTKIVIYGRAHGSDVMLISQPSLYKERMSTEESERLYFGKTIANEQINFFQIGYPSSASFYRAMKLFNAATKKIAKSEGVYFVDADSMLNKNLQNFTDDAHCTEEGAKKLAEIVARAIVENGLIERRDEKI